MSFLERLFGSIKPTEEPVDLPSDKAKFVQLVVEMLGQSQEWTFDSDYRLTHKSGLKVIAVTSDSTELKSHRGDVLQLTQTERHSIYLAVNRLRQKGADAKSSQTLKEMAARVKDFYS